MATIFWASAIGLSRRACCGAFAFVCSAVRPRRQKATGAGLLSARASETTRPPKGGHYPPQRDGYRTEERCQQDSRKHENLQRDLDHVPFST
jgi:hypothetical protein